MAVILRINRDFLMLGIIAYHLYSKLGSGKDFKVCFVIYKWSGEVPTNLGRRKKLRFISKN